MKTIIQLKPASGAAYASGAVALKKLFAFYDLWAKSHNKKIEVVDLGMQTRDTCEYTYLSFEIDVDENALKNESGLHRLVFAFDGKRYTCFFQVIVNSNEGQGFPHCVRSYVYDPYQRFKNENGFEVKELTEETVKLLVENNKETINEKDNSDNGV